MPSYRVTPTTGEVYHVYNRGVEKRDIFCEQVDYVRFIHDLFEFNDRNSAPKFEDRYDSKDIGGIGGLTPDIQLRTRSPIIEILSFCLMGNHYHLLLRQIVDGGISLFMKKLNGGYTCAFNEKYDRVGSLLQGPYKAKHVDKEEYFKHLVCYIHLNPLKFLKKFSKNGKLDSDRTWDALSKYRWSSHLDYLGENNFGSVIDKEFVLDVFGSTAMYADFLKDWIAHEAEKLEFISSLSIDRD